MGPRRSYNYGTFIATPTCSSEEDCEGANTLNFTQRSAPAFSTITASKDYRILRSGLRLAKHGAAVVIAGLNDDVASARGLCEGDEVTHIDGEPLLGSLKAGQSRIEQGRESLSLRIQPGNDMAPGGAGFVKRAKHRVIQHVVRQGDSVEVIASLYGVTANTVRLWNRKYFPVGEPGFLCPGQILTLRDTSVDRNGDGPNATNRRVRQVTNVLRRKVVGDGVRKRMLYQVREGDTLKLICERFKLKEVELRGLNRSIFPIGEAGAIFAGQILTVFAEECGNLMTAEGSGQSADEEEHRVFVQCRAGRSSSLAPLPRISGFVKQKSPCDECG